MLKTTQEIMQDIAARAKARRLALNLTQMGLEDRSGVSLGTIKHFEHTGKIALESLLKLSLALDCLQDFEQAFAARATMPQSLDDLLKQPRPRKRGSIT
ncbi:MAG: XRE family transcriptional regulator [Pseudomonadota bacterium]|nr:XRE family transcriptional regulator [Pseudomonadota bacterium]MDE3038486.1 XRE family transcriptional regulator [Pseudomonadota bacterium]